VSSPTYGSYLDNVSVMAAVPEPETYAMMLLGLGLLGFMARRPPPDSGQRRDPAARRMAGRLLHGAAAMHGMKCCPWELNWDYNSIVSSNAGIAPPGPLPRPDHQHAFLNRMAGGAGPCFRSRHHHQARTMSEEKTITETSSYGKDTPVGRPDIDGRRHFRAHCGI
jgi:hypothetical protein